MSDTPKIRCANAADAGPLLEIYRPYVESTAVSFEIEVPDVDQFAQRVAKSLEYWSWLVAEVDGNLVGYAYGTEHRARRAYRWSVETSVYVHEDHHRRGIARSLYLRLLDDLTAKGFGNAYAGVTLPNEASIGFHRSLGFESIGVFPRVGRKFGRWHDVAWLHRPLSEQVNDEGP